MILGHEKVVAYFQSLADRRALAHGYLFYGPEGVGKREVGYDLARYLEGGEHTSVLSDFLYISPGPEGTLGIDAVRVIKQFLWQTPNRSPYRTVLLNDAERLTEEAGNALLKITEEPPRASVIILVAQNPEALRSTLLSRLIKFYFSPLSLRRVEQWLLEERKLTKEKARLLAKNSFGRPGLALRLLEDFQFQTLMNVVQKLFSASYSERRELIKKIIDRDGFQLYTFLDVILLHLAQQLTHTKEKIGFWHYCMKLRRNADFLNLNPRLQLESLMLHYTA
jgi:DNA polymerase-3 subunit delta'